MKKILIAILSATICASLLISVASADSSDSSESEYIYIEGNTEVRIEKRDMTEEQIQIILYAMLGKEYDAPQIHNEIYTTCDHTYKNTQSNTIKHKVYTSQPRCMKTLYSVDVCTKCNSVKMTKISETRIFCCT